MSRPIERQSKFRLLFAELAEFLARDAFIRTNLTLSDSTAIMFVRPSVRLSVCLDHVTGVHCDNTVHVITGLSLWWASPMLLALPHQSICTWFKPVFQLHPKERLGMDVQTRRDISRTVDVSYH